jgi:hypothetical protein
MQAHGPHLFWYGARGVASLRPARSAPGAVCAIDPPPEVFRMKSLRQAFSSAVAAAALALSAGSAHAVIFGGVDFPQGASSFADALTSFAPTVNNGQPTAPHLVGTNALGAPNYDGATCTIASCTYASLGDGGSITVEFVDNRLTGSGSSALDLWIFEIGPDVEDTFVAVSKDGVTYTSVGKVFGATAGIDLDAFGFGVADQFRFVRLTDDGNEGDQSGATVGADIDAVGAISSVVATPIPEPETWAMLSLGLLVVGLHRRRSTANRTPA